jgi:hypothetical protein
MIERQLTSELPGLFQTQRSLRKKMCPVGICFPIRAIETVARPRKLSAIT